MNRNTALFTIALLAITLSVTAGAQDIELKKIMLGTGYDSEAREVKEALPEEGATVKRTEGAKVVCFTAFDSEGENYVYHVWLYRGDEKIEPAAIRSQAVLYDSVTNETTRYTLQEVLNRTPDLRELTDVRIAFVVRLRVGKSDYWRTHSMKSIDNLPSLGKWECRVYDSNERLLGKRTFTVLEE